MRILLTCLVMALAGMAAAEGGRLTVTGQGEAFAVPDMAVITLGVEERAETARAAMDAASEVVALMLARLEAGGIDPRDVQTSDLSLGPVWEQSRSVPGRSEIVGYAASNRLTVRVRALETLGGTLDALLDDGANRFSGLRFGLQETQALEDDARRMAVADAMRKARLYADAAGVTLGPIQSISEGGAPRPIEPQMMFAARAEAAVPVAAGETGLSASVTVIFALEQGGE